ncbi:unnamed protein product [Closterium sp. NIES-54]
MTEAFIFVLVLIVVIPSVGPFGFPSVRPPGRRAAELQLLPSRLAAEPPESPEPQSRRAAEPLSRRAYSSHHCRGPLSAVRCSYVIRTGTRTGQPCGTPSHTQSRCFARLSDAWRTVFGDEAELLDWVELLRQRVDIFALDYDAILTAMYALPTSADRAGHLCVPPDPGIGPAALATGEAAALGASESLAPGTGAAAALGASESASSGAVSLADPSRGPVLSHFSTVLPCPAAPSGTLSGLYLPSFSTNLVSGADLQDAGVHQFTPASQRVTHCTDARTGRHLATFSRRPGSSLYTLTTGSPPVPASGQVAASGQVFAAASRSGPESAPCSCRLLSHETLLWHHRLGHPSLPRLRGMASRVLVSGLPQSLPPLPSGPGPSCVPCVEGRLRAAPHSSQFPPTEAPLQTLHMDVWGPAPVRGQGHERYFLLVVDDYSRYTSVFPLRSKGAVTEVLIDWIREARLQLRRSFGSDFPVLRLHSDRGGEFSFRLLRDYCRAQGIRQTFTLPDSPQQNGIAERRIGMVMDVARTSMMHAAAPHFLWPFAVRYAAHQLNLHSRVSRPAMSPVLLWTGKVGDASAFRVWGSRAFVRDLSADKMSPRAAPCVFLGFPPDAPRWQFHHPSSRRVLSSQDVTFDESVPFYRLFPYRTPSLPPPPDFLVPVPPPVDPLPPQVPAPSGVSQVDAVERVEVAAESGPAAGAEPGGTATAGAESWGATPEGAELGGAAAGGAEPGGARPKGAEPGGAVSGAAEPGGAEPEGATSGAAEPGGAGPGGAEPATAGPGGSPVPPSRQEPLSPQELREWFARRWRRAAGAGASWTAEGAGAAGPGAAGPTGPTGAGAAEPGGAESRAAEPGGAESGAAEPGGATSGAAEPGVSPGAASRWETLSPQELHEWFARRWRRAAGAGASWTAEGAGAAGPGAAGPAGPTGAGAAEPGGAESRAAEPGGAESGAAEPGGATSGAAEPGVSPGAASRREPLSPQELREWFARRWRRTAGAGASSTVEGAGAAVPGAAGPAGPTGAGAAEGVGAESAAVCRDSGSAAGAAGGPAAGGVGGAGAAAEGASAVPAESGAAARPRPYFVPLLQQPTSPLPAPSPYTSPTGGLTERREPSSRPASPVRAARASGRGSRQRPPPVPGTHKMSLRPSTAPLRAPLPSPPESSLPALADPESDSLCAASPTVTRLLATVVTDPLFESTAASALVAELVDFAARCRLDYAASLVAESASVCPPSVGGECALGTDVLEDRQEELQCLAAASPHLASVLLAPEGDPDALDIPTPRSYAEAVEGPYSSQWQAAMDAEMASWKSTGTYVDAVPPPGANIVSGMWIFRVKRPPGSPPVFKARYVARGFSHADASWADDQATQRSSQGYTFSLGSGSVSWRATRSSSVLSSSCEAEIYAGAMAAQELRWLTYLLTDLGEPPRSPPVLYVDNKAMLALCREQRLEHRTKHIALRYFLARELQQRGQLRLAYVASEANTADVFTKALAPCDHQRFCTQLGLVPVLPHLLSS